MAKKTKVDLGKGFKRIYFVIAGLYMSLYVVYTLYGNVKTSHDVMVVFFNLAWPVGLYFFLKWIIAGFKK